ncbi:hypothetical protein COW36_07210 [bacterium (Candidatus Blackallbacteria) CG17_big_fil_post_rev_8_21_14_2_50_48_46]|uniref:Uncharacterized protein n=1 Tax=bacterium (Candidatus Blackallbacteria) CG17_big_fil_post_rev_8_21_14_2_50_48_46 TaxID=2014261 RepID=A0A2M7G717_9BACT|nr:MAG: hypothetical protein COW64_06720 [bacterium (Candidatus Blackallbacteria) CG18_big_fil_WC_8_21_14_2_50_49_26]PIW17850.1 MAG: hypothetical protein COW36_07210 [bacterium (Candidatus Blackallbacteria) CG17_big_fil_post_rev_8_21_14_2_50_48_46]PIW48526.1 MAG: hypothetical protein COW20_09165 [bacterium (Candidatus Blackallbacteria) CG13_big_fil_rev_8_21_14_2_50_49_14]
MVKKILCALFWLGLTAAPVWAEAPLGDFRCVGSNPGQQKPYKGYVHIEKSGETYTVLWRFGATTYIGTGIEQGDAFAVIFSKTESTNYGLILFRKDKKKGHWIGRWTQPGSKAVGSEVWGK